ncbi:hypothetical protein CPB84DRAFT_1788906 [Gymnopilus junonius]|uniref:F-box domain-containing protein n=1 Tax=Gymnopilus junonius TaxID=109634 RepID=A0A9P5NGY7_GYMJU|nr:hypothetical protein CPB84DRAFT_1788906 [Gymnopilus junonius]
MPPLKSPSSSHLHTNHVPGETERVKITQFLHQHESTMAEFKRKQTFLRRALDHHKEERDRLERTILQHRALISPLRILPDDILLTIFLFYVKDHFLTRMALHQGAIHQWLARSHPFPVSRIPPPASSEYFWGLSADDYRNYLVLLISIFHRLRALEVALPSGDFSAFFASLVPEELPMLETIHLTFLYHWHHHDEKWWNTGLFKVHTLREMELVQFPSPSRTSRSLGARSRLCISSTPKSINYWQERGLSLEDTYSVLIQCVNLVELGIEVTDFSGATHPPGLRKIHLPYLQSITLLDATYHLATLIDRIELPILKSIQYQTKFCPTDLRRSPLLVLLSKTHWGTEKLVTNVEFLTMNELLWCFFYTPNLTHFRHEAMGVAAEQTIYLFSCRALPVDFLRGFLEFLIPDRYGKCSWPWLTHVHIKGARLDSLDDHFVQRLVEGRAGGGRGRQKHDTPVQALKHVKIEPRPLPFDHQFLNREFPFPSLSYSSPHSRYTLPPLPLPPLPPPVVSAVNFQSSQMGGAQLLYPHRPLLSFLGFDSQNPRPNLAVAVGGTFDRGFSGDLSRQWSATGSHDGLDGQETLPDGVH